MMSRMELAHSVDIQVVFLAFFTLVVLLKQLLEF